jgi:hypothetical protein
MNYKRVIPRDLFNEANLLKCLGQIALLVHDYGNAYPKLLIDADYYETCGASIYQTDDGELYTNNVSLYIDGAKYTVLRKLNSREAYPVFIIYNDEYIDIFTKTGKFSKEFLKLIQ